MKNKLLLLVAGTAFVWAGCGEQVGPLNPGGDQPVGATASLTTQQVTEPAGYYCETITFNGLGHGTVITSLSAATVTMDVTVTPGIAGNFPSNVAILYDTDNVGGPDADLEAASFPALTGLEEILVIEDGRGFATQGDTYAGGIITLDNFSESLNYIIPSWKAIDDDDGPFALFLDGVETNARSSTLGNGTVETIVPSQVAFTTSADFWLGIASPPGETPVQKTASGGFDDILFCAECAGRIGDFVWYDTDMDGIQDAGEVGIPGVTVTLTLPDASTVTTTTDANGYYLFDDLCPGTYYVAVTPPAGYVASPAEQGGDPARDSNVNPSTTTLTTVVDEDLTIDWGFYIQRGLEGCTPGYWKQEQHYFAWTFPLAPGAYFTAPGFDSPGSDARVKRGQDEWNVYTQLDALEANQGDLAALTRHAMAALLNAASPDVDYQYTQTEIINWYNAALAGSLDVEDLKDDFDYYNNGPDGCPLGNDNDD